MKNSALDLFVENSIDKFQPGSRAPEPKLDISPELLDSVSLRGVLENMKKIALSDPDVAEKAKALSQVYSAKIERMGSFSKGDYFRDNSRKVVTKDDLEGALSQAKNGIVAHDRDWRDKNLSTLHGYTRILEPESYPRSVFKNILGLE